MLMLICRLRSHATAALRCAAAQAAVQQALRVLSGMVGELAPDIRQRLVGGVQSSKVALFKRPEQVWTDIPEHSIWKGTEFGANDWLSGEQPSRQAMQWHCPCHVVHPACVLWCHTRCFQWTEDSSGATTIVGHHLDDHACTPECQAQWHQHAWHA